ncbi:MAG: MFS transporter [Anaerolineae bacterium]|nr:MFS transporter [Anaerolineae bacterium]
MQRLPLPAFLLKPLGYPPVSTLPEERQKGLRVFWLDGLFASLSGGFIDSYYALYMLSLGASNAQIGLVNTLNQVAGAVMALPGAAIADRTGRYRFMSTITGLIARLLWLVMLIAPWLLPDAGAVWLVLLAWVLIAGVGTMGAAAWTALQADLVPARLRGAYFSSRNIVMQVVRLGVIPVAGLIVNWIGEPGGYQVNLGLAFAFGMVAVYYYSQIPEHVPSPHEQEQISNREILRNIRHMPLLMRFTLGHGVLMFGVMFGGPFISVYMAEELDFSVGTIGFVTTTSVLATTIGMRILGRIQDRYGITWTMRFGLGVPFITSAWLLVQHPWQAYIVSALAALTWAGYNLGAFNLLLAVTPNAHRPRYVAMHTTIISVVGAVGPLTGGVVLDAVGFTPVFLLSTVGRGLGLLLFFLLVREPDPVVEVDEDNADGEDVGG